MNNNANSGTPAFIARAMQEEYAWVTVISPRASMRAPSRRPQFIVLETRGGVVVDVEAFVDAAYGYEVKGEMVCEAGAIMPKPNPAIPTREAGHEMFIVEFGLAGPFQDRLPRADCRLGRTRSGAESRGERAPGTDMPPRSRRALASKLGVPRPEPR